MSRLASLALLLVLTMCLGSCVTSPYPYPPPGPGYAWVPGHWVAGPYGYHWVPAHYRWVP